MLSEHPSEKQPPLDAGAQRIARWRSQGREMLKKEQEQATGRMRRMKTRIEPLSGGNTGAIPPIHTPQLNAVTPWHGCGDVLSPDIFETPTLEIEAVKPPKTEGIPLIPPVKTRVRNHASDVAPDEECVHVIGDKWHYDSPNHSPDRAALNAVIERYHTDLGTYPAALEASESLCGSLMLQQLLHIYNGEAFYLYVAAHGKVHPVRIQPNFWAPFWCISSRIPPTNDK